MTTILKLYRLKANPTDVTEYYNEYFYFYQLTINYLTILQRTDSYAVVLYDFGILSVINTNHNYCFNRQGQFFYNLAYLMIIAYFD